MRRYPPYDPPEYVDWQPDPRLVQEYAERLSADAERRAILETLDAEALLGLYAGLLRNRLHDIMLKRWVRQGVISKAWLGTGEEAVTIGSVHALERGSDVVAPMIRNAGACHEMGMSLESMFRGYLGTADAPNGGRDLHIGDPARGVIQPVSHVGDMVPVMTGAALAFRQRGELRVALTWVGDGATKTAAFHEGINLAAVLRLPVILILQNNQVALGTRLDQHHAGDFRAWPRTYGVAGAWADGNNVLDVYAATRLAAQRARTGGGPTLLVVDTFRMGGHATHDEAEARATFAAALFEEWGRRDPIGLFEEYLVGAGVAREELERVEEQLTLEVERAAERALESRAAGMPAGAAAEWAGFSAGVRQPGLAWRLSASSHSQPHPPPPPT
ncbi:MAG: thiamine pyrophosphate-dependent dehydrogenase E1 component subunit alpha [Gemmatimonadetes bacterium]|nr:thiamine pyrophosphate-dependent dehydrogenase E1 component subunit alpha [Gemmatimonadota bacterium]